MSENTGEEASAIARLSVKTFRLYTCILVSSWLSQVSNLLIISFTNITVKVLKWVCACYIFSVLLKAEKNLTHKIHPDIICFFLASERARENP